MLKEVILIVLKSVANAFVSLITKPHKLTWYDLYVLIVLASLILLIIFVKI